MNKVNMLGTLLLCKFNDFFFLGGMKNRCSDETKPRAKPYKFSNQKLKDLGLEFTPVKQCLYETVKSLQEKGHLPLPTQENDEPLTIIRS